MSTHQVLVTQIDKVENHPNADRLDLVHIKGWVCVTQRGAFQPGDLCVYIPIDSVLPPEVELMLFPADSKIKLSKSRVKTAKIRGCVSQGMCVRPADIGVWESVKVGQDLAQRTGIKKYEPPQKLGPKSNANPLAKRKTNPYFKKYTDLENVKNYPNVFAQGEFCFITEKVHGTNFRAGWVPFYATTWWQRFKKFLGFAPEWTFVYGSRNMELTSHHNKSTNYYAQKNVAKNLYLEAVEKYELEQKLKPGEVVYGEVYGDGVQKGYGYGCQPGERKLVLFDLQLVSRTEAVYQDTSDFFEFCKERNLPSVPLLYSGPFHDEIMKTKTTGPSVLAPSQAVREGCVVRPARESTASCGRKLLKSINADYLLSSAADEEVAHDQVQVA